MTPTTTSAQASRGPTAAGVLVATFAVLILLAGALTLLGRGSPTSGPSATARSASPTPTTARDGGAGRQGEPSGRCGDIAPLTPLEGPEDPGDVVSATRRGVVDTSALLPTYGDLQSVPTFHVTDAEELVAQLDPTDPDGRLDALLDGAFVEAAQRRWQSTDGDDIRMTAVQLGSPDQALAYADAHLIEDCETASPIVPSSAVPGAVTYFSQPANRKPTATLVMVLGSTEVTLTLCTCRPRETARDAGQAWAATVADHLVVPGTV